MMQHSFETNINIYGQSILGGNALKNRRGEDTSEALQLRQVNFITGKVNIKNLNSMKHNPEDRKVRKKISKQVKLDKSFHNEKIIHYKAI